MAKKKAPAEAVVFDERAPRQGPLGDIQRHTEADLIAAAAAQAKPAKSPAEPSA